MAFNGGGCDTDGPHNKRLCTGQSNGSNNDSNNNSSQLSSGLCSNGTNAVDVDMKQAHGHILGRVN